MNTVEFADHEILQCSDADSMAKIMNDRFHELEDEGEEVNTVEVTEDCWIHMRDTLGKTRIDEETHKEIIKQGIVGNIWGARIHVSKVCPPGCLRVYDDEILSKA